jgi:hypothetical protein
MSKLFNPEVAEAIQETNIIELSEKARLDTLDSAEQDAIDVLDNFAREIGNAGASKENNVLLSELIKKTVEPLLFQPDRSVLYNIFDMGTVGEFDESRFTGVPKNTIKVHDAVRGGSVPMSYVDPTVFATKKVALQAETEINYADLRRNGWKSIAKMTELARESFEQELFYRLFAGIDAVLDPIEGDQDINTGSALTVGSAEAHARYLRDMSEGNPFMIGLSKYIDGTARMQGYEAHLSDELKNELNRVGRLAMFDGVALSSVPTARKTASGNVLIPDKRIFGIAGKIGEANMRGDLRVYETYDNDAEKVKLKFTGYDFEYAIYYLDKIARIKFD